MNNVDILLRESGWEVGRKANLERIKRLYFDSEYVWNDIQNIFLKEYAYLEIKYMSPIWKQEVILSLNPLNAQDQITYDIIEDYEEFLEESLLIIGEIERENMTLLLSKTGNFYGAYDDCIIEWGTDFKVFIYDLINGIKGDMVIID
ncbi:SUKH-3 domain-containing protein [Lacrimispora xylanisolvens]|uniref:SUKH-3 domain-containing protein n=1 Tax=Lacrimispora xylanisolvens TaxID=384636 RepID=UPI002402A693|nr:hypothetical protein [Paenibacillaceae bacterium]